MSEFDGPTDDSETGDDGETTSDAQESSEQPPETDAGEKQHDERTQEELAALRVHRKSLLP